MPALPGWSYSSLAHGMSDLVESDDKVSRHVKTGNACALMGIDPCMASDTITALLLPKEIVRYAQKSAISISRCGSGRKWRGWGSGYGPAAVRRLVPRQIARADTATCVLFLAVPMCSIHPPSILVQTTVRDIMPYSSPIVTG